MIEAFIPLFRSVQQELAKGLDETSAIREYGKQIHQRLHRIAQAVEKLEKTGWAWNTTYETIVLFKESSEEKAAEELLNSGILEGEFHFGYPG